MVKPNLSELKKDIVFYEGLVALLQMIDTAKAVYATPNTLEQSRQVLIDCDVRSVELKELAHYIYGVAPYNLCYLDVANFEECGIKAATLEDKFHDVSSILYDDRVYCAKPNEDAYAALVLCNDVIYRYGKLYKAIEAKLPKIPNTSYVDYLRVELDIEVSPTFFPLLRNTTYVLDTYGKRAAFTNIRTLWKEHESTMRQILKWLQVERLFTPPV